MIQLSNTDAERVCRHLNEIFQSRKTRRDGGLREINETRMLGLLLEKINKKLNKECPNGNKSMPNRSKDSLRSSVIDELITADNWFTIVKDEEKVKLFSCTTPQILKSSIVTLMLQEEQYASLFVEAVGEYVKRQRPIDFLRISKN